MNEQRIQIDRMVDGELSKEEQRELLLSCESENRWRDLALAYVEDQAFGTLIETSLLSDSEPSNILRSEGMEPSLIRNNNDVGSSQSDTSQSRAARSKDSFQWNWMSLAAAILLSLGLGYGLGWWWQSDSINGPALANSESTLPRKVEDDSSVQLANSGQQGQGKIQTLPFVLPDPMSSELRQVDIPVVNASDLGPNWQQRLNSANVPDDLLQDWRDQGLNVRQTRTMTRIRMPDGRLVLVPIDYFYEQPFQ